MSQDQVTPPTVTEDDIQSIDDDAFTGRNVCLCLLYTS
ncbi:short-chain dehydrogenase/reductase SDR, partial [Natronorubrum tibetense GA33]